jgi:Ca2+-binding RTX toxin-like protein
MPEYIASDFGPDGFTGIAEILTGVFTLGTITSSSATRIVMTIGPAEIIIVGSGLTVSGNTITGGTLETITATATASGSRLARLKDLGMDADDINTALLAEAGGDTSAMEIYAYAFDWTIDGANTAAVMTDPQLNGDGIQIEFAGDDNFVMGTGNDVIVAGKGDDRVNTRGGDDSVSGGNGDDLIRGGGGSDVLHGDRGADTIIGGGSDDTIVGGAGRDDLRGGSGGDQILGGKGADVIDGGGGNDTIAGGEGTDILSGGNGSDTFFFMPSEGNNTITDFDVTEDSLDLFNEFAGWEAEQDGDDVLITNVLGDTTILILDVSVDDITL